MIVFGDGYLERGRLNMIAVIIAYFLYTHLSNSTRVSELSLVLAVAEHTIKPYHTATAQY